MIFRRLKLHFFNGLLLLAPAFLTMAIVYRIFLFVYSLMDFGVALIPGKYRAVPHIDEITTAGTILLTVLFIWILGLLVKTYLGRMTRRHLRRFIHAIPFAGAMYRAFRQMMDAAFGPAPLSYSRVVLVEFPFKGSRSVGFITGEASERIMVPDADGSLKESYKVFIPGTPNPASGFLLIVPKEDVIMTDLSVEQGFLSVVSGGLLRQHPEKDG